LTTSAIGDPPDYIDPVDVPKYLPGGKIGQGNFLYIYNSGTQQKNYMGLLAISGRLGYGIEGGGAGLKPIQALYIDTKLDDGFPQTGKLRAAYREWAGWDILYPNGAVPHGGTSDTSATAPDAFTCYDNNNSASARQHYTTSQGELNFNCALSLELP
jgi:hypothetical protein